MSPLQVSLPAGFRVSKVFIWRFMMPITMSSFVSLWEQAIIDKDIEKAVEIRRQITEMMIELEGNCHIPSNI